MTTLLQQVEHLHRTMIDWTNCPATDYARLEKYRKQFESQMKTINGSYARMLNGRPTE